jgi:hypothetical protein
MNELTTPAVRYPGLHGSMCSRELHKAKPERYDDLCDCGIEAWAAARIAEACTAALAEREAEVGRLTTALARADWLLGEAYGNTDDPRLREVRTLSGLPSVVDKLP